MSLKILPYIVAECRKKRGLAPCKDHSDFIAAVINEPALLDAARKMKADLEGKPGDPRRLYQHDAVSKEQHKALCDMIARAETRVEKANG